MSKFKIYAFFLIALFINIQISGASTYSCSHHEICRMTQIILNENSIKNVTLENIVIQSGDPHEFEPSIQLVKKLVNTPSLIVGPQELNPWMKNISHLRQKEKNLTTFTLPLPSFATQEYPTPVTEALGHFWLYPKIYCHFKKLVSEKLQADLKFKGQFKCDANLIEAKLSSTLQSISIPIILTHDALLPLFNRLSHTKNNIIAIKGSTHHGEASSAVIKSVHDALKKKKVIWILEDNIATLENVKNKIRSSDIVIKIDTAKSQNSDGDFTLLESLNQKLQEIKP